MFVSYCSDIKLFGVVINNCYGFVILLISPNNNVILNNVNISFTSSSAQCFINLYTSCGGSALILSLGICIKEVLQVDVLVNNILKKAIGTLYHNISNAANVNDKRSKELALLQLV